MFLKCFVFVGNASDNYGRTWKADDAGALTSTILVTFQFHVTGWGPWVCISSITIICSMTYSKYLCRSLRCHLRFLARLSTLRSPSPEKKNIIFFHYSKIETDLKKQMTSIGRESIVGFHMASLKFKLQKVSILLRSYFHDVLEQLKTNFHTTFRFCTKTRSLYIYLVSFPRFRTLTIERFWFLFWYVLNGVTLPETSNRIVIGCFSLLPC